MNIWVPKIQIVEAYPDKLTPVTMRGEFQITKRDRWGRVLYEGPRFSNLILNSGLNRLGVEGAIIGAAIGTGTAAPDAAQTGLQAQTTFTTTGAPSNGVITSNSSSPFQNTRSFVYRTALGALNGNFTEVGVGWASGSMFARELIRDGSGNPTTISVASDEQLDIAYRLSVFPPLVDTSNTVTITGSGSHTVTGRAALVTDTGSWPVSASVAQVNAGGSFALSGGLGAIASTPGGGAAGTPTSNSTAAYVNNSYARQGSLTWGLNDGNSALFRSVMVQWVNMGRFQYDYGSAGIAKNNTRTLVLNYGITWARA